MQLGEDLIETWSGWCGGKLCESTHPIRAGCTGQVVYAEMKGRVHIGYGPLDRNRDGAAAGNRAQQKRRLDVVVIGDRDQSGELQAIFNLAAFEIKG